jgi:LysR family transcriptional regulator, regulator for bpeEF and oprC
MEIIELQTFVTVVRSKSFTAASEILETDKAHVSRLVSRLEASLGAQLLTRTTRSLAVTEIGKDVFERAIGVLAAIEETKASAARAQAAPSGVLKLTCVEEFGVLVVSQWITLYQKTYPNMRVEVDLTNRVIDLVHEGFDLAIRVGSLPDSGLSARKLGEVGYALYATHDYLAVNGEPRTPDDLAKHDLLLPAAMSHGVFELTRDKQTISLPIKSKFSTNNNIMLRKAAAAGLGIALLPQFQAAPLVALGQLHMVLNRWSRATAPIHAVFPPSRYLAPKVRVFVDLARTRFEESISAGSTF